MIHYGATVRFPPVFCPHPASLFVSKVRRRAGSLLILREGQPRSQQEGIVGMVEDTALKRGMLGPSVESSPLSSCVRGGGRR